MLKSSPSIVEDVQLTTNWNDVICPICLEFPHNSVLLHCSSYAKGCRPFICDTDHLHSNCLDRFKISQDNSTPNCPLCRGKVIGWIIVSKIRLHLDKKRRCCENNLCPFKGNHMELKEHAQLKHPYAQPTKIDPVQQLDWDNFQQSSETIDVLNTIHSEVPSGVVFGDFVIEYRDADVEDEFANFPGDEGNWWTSCMLYQVFDNFRASRSIRRSRRSGTRMGNRRTRFDASISDEGSVASTEFSEYRISEAVDDTMNTSTVSRTRGSSMTNGHRSYRRRLSCFYDN